MFRKKYEDLPPKSVSVEEYYPGLFRVRADPYNGSEQAKNFADKVIQLMKAEGLTYETALQIPALLHRILNRSYGNQIVKTLYEPLFYDGNNNGNDRDTKSKD